MFCTPLIIHTERIGVLYSYNLIWSIENERINYALYTLALLLLWRTYFFHVYALNQACTNLYVRMWPVQCVWAHIAEYVNACLSLLLPLYAELRNLTTWCWQVSVAPGGRWNRFRTYSTIQRTLEIWGSVLTFIFKAWLNNQKFSYRGW